MPKTENIFSLENIFPYLWYRKGISNRSDIGFRVGLPIYGSGFDYSRRLYEKENKWDMLNLAWSLNPNYNYDVTYYKFKQGKNKISALFDYKDNKLNICLILLPIIIFILGFLYYLSSRKKTIEGFHTIERKKIKIRKVFAAGSNHVGQLGLGHTSRQSVFTKVNISNVKQIICGWHHTFILKNDGTLWATGYNGFGQLGLGDTDNRKSFKEVNINNVKQVSGGIQHTFI